MKKKNEEDELQFLQSEFEDWYHKTYDEAGGNAVSLDTPPAEMLRRLKLSEEEYYNIYIEPYVNLTKEDLETTFKILAPELAAVHMEEILPLCTLRLNLDLKIQRKLNALDWLLFQVAELCLFKLSPNLYKKTWTPEKQCFYCGRPDFYERKESDKIKIIKFNGRNRFCHVSGCGKGTNPEKHQDGCCYKNWARMKKTLEQALKRVCEEIYKNPMDFDEGRFDRDEEIKIREEAKKIFIEFCEKQYRKNLKINYTIQSELGPAVNLIDFYL